MEKGRLEAFTDGVLAIVITIMVLETRTPDGYDLSAILAALPAFFAYALSYVNVGIVWNNHHHIMHATERVNGQVLWANLFLLFWVSLIPLMIRWMNDTHFAAPPTAAYGVTLVPGHRLRSASMPFAIPTKGMDGQPSPTMTARTRCVSPLAGWCAIRSRIVAAEG